MGSAAWYAESCVTVCRVLRESHESGERHVIPEAAGPPLRASTEVTAMQFLCADQPRIPATAGRCCCDYFSSVGLQRLSKDLHLTTRYKGWCQGGSVQSTLGSWCSGRARVSNILRCCVSYRIEELARRAYTSYGYCARL